MSEFFADRVSSAKTKDDLIRVHRPSTSADQVLREANPVSVTTPMVEGARLP